MTGHQRAGKLSRISVGASNQALTFASWDIDMRLQDLPTPNFESFSTLGSFLSSNTAPVSTGDTYDEGISGVRETDLSFGGDWDAGANPVDAVGAPNAPGLYPRDDLANLQFDANRLDSITNATFPWARIRTSRVGTSVGGKVTFTCTGKSQGWWTTFIGSA